MSYFKTNKIWVATATPPFSNHHPDQSEAINIETRPSTRKNTMTIEGTHDGYQFLAIVFLGMYIVLDIMLLYPLKTIV